MCLDSLGRSPSLYMHVSKPPRETSASGVLLSTAQSAYPGHVHLSHKKINLADEMLAWEHERYSIRRLPAFTLSAVKVSPKDQRDIISGGFPPPFIQKHLSLALL